MNYQRRRNGNRLLSLRTIKCEVRLLKTKFETRSRFACFTESLIFGTIGWIPSVIKLKVTPPQINYVQSRRRLIFNMKVAWRSPGSCLWTKNECTTCNEWAEDCRRSCWEKCYENKSFYALPSETSLLTDFQRHHMFSFRVWQASRPRDFRSPDGDISALRLLSLLCLGFRFQKLQNLL